MSKNELSLLFTRKPLRKGGSRTFKGHSHSFDVDENGTLRIISSAIRRWKI
jgi:hypothetical protein